MGKIKILSDKSGTYEGISKRPSYWLDAECTYALCN